MHASLKLSKAKRNGTSRGIEGRQKEGPLRKKGEEVCGFAKGFFDTIKNAKTLIGTLIQRGEMQESPARILQLGTYRSRDLNAKSFW